MWREQEIAKYLLTQAFTYHGCALAELQVETVNESALSILLVSKKFQKKYIIIKNFLLMNEKWFR